MPAGDCLSGIADQVPQIGAEMPDSEAHTLGFAPRSGAA
jgi:hypothetical protein